MNTLLMSMRDFTAKAVGTPFKDGGRDWAGFDCWGCVYLCFRDCLGINLPSYGDTSALDLAKIAGVMKNESIAEPWVPVSMSGLRAFDVVVMHRRREPIHVGIMASATEILHIEEKINAALLPLTHPTIRFRYPKFIRHRQLLDHAA